MQQTWMRLSDKNKGDFLMPNLNDQILLIIIDKLAIGLIILIASLVIAFYLNRQLEKFKKQEEQRQEIERLQNETELKHIREQIIELYGPLNGLIESGDAINQIFQKRLALAKNENERGQIEYHFRKNYFVPLNQKQVELITTKTHLLEGVEFPNSFRKLLRHHAQFETLLSLGETLNLESTEISPEPYPVEFVEEVQTNLEQLRARYNNFRNDWDLTHN